MPCKLCIGDDETNWNRERCNENHQVVFKTDLGFVTNPGGPGLASEIWATRIMRQWFQWVGLRMG
jgi:hypothetical protein